MTPTDDLREAVARQMCETAGDNWTQGRNYWFRKADRIIRMVVDACAERAADFVWLRLYRGGGDRALPVMSFHSREIAAAVRELAPKELSNEKGRPVAPGGVAARDARSIEQPVSDHNQEPAP